MNGSKPQGPGAQNGFSLIEVLIALVIGAVLIVSLQRVVATAFQVKEVGARNTELSSRARFAMSRMVKAVRDTDRLLLPLQDRSNTNWPENIREQTVPASAPVGSSTLATAVLAVAMPSHWDTDRDGVPDADNDRDGRIDEDWPADMHNDGEDGIANIDDNGNGSVDESFWSSDDDEYLSFPDEDRLNGFDDDGDGSVDEDTPADMNGDGAPGIAGVDDDGDGSVDEGDDKDDDEDGQVDEDWLDPVVYLLQGSDLIERRTVPWDTNSDTVVTGSDVVETILATGVTRLRFECIDTNGGDHLIDITLTLADASGEITLNRRLRLR